MTEPKCPYCGDLSVLTDSAEVYGGKSYGNIWICRPCQAWVGVHKTDAYNRPLGRLANAELRRWKMKAHGAFDPLWKKACFSSRGAAYTWLAKELGLSTDTCHIGMFDVDTCKKVTEVCPRKKQVELSTDNGGGNEP